MIKFLSNLAICLLISSSLVYPQFDILKKVKEKTEKKIEEEIDKSLEGKNKEEKEKDNTKSEKTTEPGENKDTKEETKSTALESYSKYDFIPGDQILLFEDFSQDAVGDFPALWTTDVAGEINTLNIAPGNWFNLNSTEGTYWFMNDIDFPENFIMEMDIVPKTKGGRIAADLVFWGEKAHSEMNKEGDPGLCGLHIVMEKENWYSKGYKAGVNERLTGSSDINPVEPDKVNHVIVWVQKRRARIYHKGAKVLDVPTNIYADSKFNRISFKLHRGASCGSYISNIKITTAAPDTRSKLLTEGKLVTYGIYFDVNKDVVKPESYGTLKDIATVLQENPAVKVKIVGHTDSDGDDNSNLDLSKRRSTAVKDALVKNFSIDAARIETDGKGESEPVATNNSPEDKAKNRRVEFLKL